MQLFQRTNLFAEFFSVANDFVGRHRRIETALLFLFSFDEPRNTIERNAPVITDDSSATVGIRKSGQYVRTSASPHFRCIGVKDRIVVGFSVLCECLNHDADPVHARRFSVQSTPTETRRSA